MKKFLLLASLTALTASLTACGDGSNHHHDGYDDSQSAPAASATTRSPGSSPDASVAPLLVVVDTNQTMNAIGGDGVGVFVEYSTGGHWHVWWTCDTNQTQAKCNFVVGITAASGAIKHLDASGLAGGFATLSSTTQLDASSTTTTAVTGVSFDTDPGAQITLDATMGNLTYGSFLFFVQDGKVNGGYASTLSNPLSLVGSTP